MHMSFEPDKTVDFLEEQLASAAPALPPGLRGRTLAHCAAEIELKNRRRESRTRGLAYALAGVFTLQWLLLAGLDNQRNLIVASDEPTGTSRYVKAETPPIDATDSGELQVALRLRSRNLAALMTDDQWMSPADAG
jgi:hypothetical protein